MRRISIAVATSVTLASVAGCAHPGPGAPAASGTVSTAMVAAAAPGPSPEDALPPAPTHSGPANPLTRPTLAPGQTGPAATALPGPVAPSDPTDPSATATFAPAAWAPTVVVPPAATARPSRGGVTLAPTRRGPLTGRTVTVDPGHNGVYSRSINTRLVPAGGGRRKACNTSGTGNSRQSEHALTWAVAGKVVALLRARGARVVLTRPDDRGVGPCVDERAAIGNRTRSDIAVSIHADGNTRRSARGFHVIRSTRMSGGAAAQASSDAFARTLRTELARTGMPRSTYLGGGTAITPRSDIAGLNLSRIPAAMVELGNMMNASDAALFRSSAFQNRAARAIADATQARLTAR